MATALYRRYRPDTFADVIGQQHVTDPLRAALRSGKVGQAYLFSGPRGCGKTTSARILARCLNCAQGPTDTPCGTCDSCVELARGGSGSLDVVEIDAASHGGVDDARELRERATFAPARDRQKIFIIDEAHMVTPQGFNALLKIVEEPPPHIAFIFATTEPDKVLGTIRSRTHHYPFRLVPPQVLQGHLQQVCEAEGVAVGTGVLPLVVRAGAGSVRDSLSVLDQLAAGAGPGGIDYEHAVALLGYTHATLLDDVTAAFAAGDGATVFQVVDRVISSGQDPRRFVDDLLQRLRDLVVVQAVGERAHVVFPGVPADQLERMALQAAGFGAAQLSRAADLANTAATEMTGATSPRLHLELLCARMLLPAADDGERGLAARLDRVERRLSVPGQGVPAAGAPAPSAGSPAAPGAAPEAAGGDAARGAQHVRELMARRRDPLGGSAAGSPEPTEAPAAPAAEPVAQTPGQAPVQAPVQAPAPRPSGDGALGAGGAPERAPEQVPPPTAPDEQPRQEVAAAAEEAPTAPEQPAVVAVAPDPVGAVPSPAPGGADTTEAVRRMWPEVLDHLAGTKRRTWTRVSQDAQVALVDDQRVVLQFARPNTLQAFSSGPHADFVRESLIAVLGLDRVVIAVNAGAPLPGGTGGGGGAQRPAPQRQEPVARRPEPRDDAPAAPPRPPVAAPPAPREQPQEAAPEPAREPQPQPRQDPRQELDQEEQPRPRQEERRPDPERARSRPDRGPSRSAAPAQRSRRGASAPPPWDDAPPPEPPDDGEPPPPEFDDPWTAESSARTSTSRPQQSDPEPAVPSAPVAEPTPRTAAPTPGAGAASPPPWASDTEQARPVPQPAARAAAPAVPAPAQAPAAPPAPAAGREAPSGPLRGADLARSAVRARSATSTGTVVEQRSPDDEPSRDDPDAEGSGQVGLPVVQRVLGGRVLSIDERS